MKKKGNIISKSALQEYLKYIGNLAYYSGFAVIFNYVCHHFRNNVAVLNVFYADMTGYNYRNDIHYGKDDLFCKLNLACNKIFINLY